MMPIRRSKQKYIPASVLSVQTNCTPHQGDALGQVEE